MRRFLWIFLALFVFSVTMPTHALAANEFSSALESTYTVQPNGSTHVEQDFHITNNFSTVYISEYALEIGSNHVSNIVASEGTTKLTPIVTPRGNKTGVEVQFSDKVIGKDKTRDFQVSYDTDDIAIHTGNILEINIPKLANPADFSSYIVHVSAPGSYGSPSLTSPATYTTTTDQGKTIVSFQNVGQDSGISVLFGKEQYAHLQLTYHIQNPTPQTVSTTLALPPDTTHQRMWYQRIDPKPDDITTNADGNWLAHYTLAPTTQETVTITGTAVITLTAGAQTPFVSTPPTKEELAATEYWQVNDPKIQSLAKQLKTPKAIYDFVIQTLSYDYTRLDAGNKRFGAIGALQNPTQSACLEFTDLFVALSRAAGIPAREVDGFAYTQNSALRPLGLVQDVLHAWPEYWDASKNQWIDVDPTWGDTTGGVDYFSHFDFNHIAFVIHGASSTQPLAAGLYKLVGDDTKDITVSFDTSVQKDAGMLSAHVVLRPSLLPTENPPYSTRVRNLSLHALYDIPYAIRATIHDGTTVNTNGTIHLLPLSSQDIPIQLPGLSIFTNRSIVIESQVGDQVFTDTINVQSFIVQHQRALFITFLVGICALAIAFLARSLLVPRWKR
ncbi:hypothetical protein C5B42_00250 [Candidatus Cerribacteria bacterium 'Amazon FNV 2010 28 9']|uniref:Transglutaminase-like domain-containing protein n=1 Tax=Candidatus Cerribacteria bacterium 'Amazon FNV 2010 28 9' TaxID=2081795 RepID=A0A317JQH6_9BACT|nr:MAG: hypothetical protein C5B42_00250 [Candidatus Cerribacteria bacterium 'Amazon FNV 2010 28 9']